MLTLDTFFYAHTGSNSFYELLRTRGFKFYNKSTKNKIIISCSLFSKIKKSTLTEF